MGNGTVESFFAYPIPLGLAGCERDKFLSISLVSTLQLCAEALDGSLLARHPASPSAAPASGEECEILYGAPPSPHLLLFNANLLIIVSVQAFVAPLRETKEISSTVSLPVLQIDV